VCIVELMIALCFDIGSQVCPYVSTYRGQGKNIYVLTYIIICTHFILLRIGGCMSGLGFEWVSPWVVGMITANCDGG
jgi:hypothetical protein